MKKFLCSFLLICTLLAIPCFSHSGRTDGSGGHKDNENRSGLGYYHYHCGGNPPHLHSDGICPFSYNASSITAFDNTPEKNVKIATTKVSKNYTVKKADDHSMLIGIIVLVIFVVFPFLAELIATIREKAKNKKEYKQSLTEYYEAKKIIEENKKKRQEERLRVQKALLPANTAIDEDGLPYLINREYGYGKLYNAFITESGTHFHRSRCPRISGHKKICIHRYEAVKKYTPCSECNPINYIDEWYLRYKSLN